MMNNKRKIEVARVSLSNSEAYVIQVGVTFSAAQRRRLIEKGIADPRCRTFAPRPRETYLASRSYDLPLTELGCLIRSNLMNGDGRNVALGIAAG